MAKKVEQQAKREARIRHIELLALKEPALWDEVNYHIERGANQYDEAINRLEELRDIAVHFKLRDAFSAKLQPIKQVESYKGVNC